VHRSRVKKPLPRRTLLLLPLSYPFHHRGGVVLGRWGGSSSSAAVVFQHDFCLLCARPCGVVALSRYFLLPLSAVSRVLSCPAPLSCSKENYIPIWGDIINDKSAP
jgi:hypothetical protein